MSLADLLSMLFSASATFTRASTCRVRERIQRSLVSGLTFFERIWWTAYSMPFFRLAVAVNNNSSELNFNTAYFQAARIQLKRHVG